MWATRLNGEDKGIGCIGQSSHHVILKYTLSHQRSGEDDSPLSQCGVCSHSASMSISWLSCLSLHSHLRGSRYRRRFIRSSFNRKNMQPWHFHAMKCNAPKGITGLIICTTAVPTLAVIIPRAFEICWLVASTHLTRLSSSSYILSYPHPHIATKSKYIQELPKFIRISRGWIRK